MTTSRPHDVPLPESRSAAATAEAQPARSWAALSGPILLAGGAATVVLIALAALDAGGRATTWELIHWNVSALSAVAATAVAIPGSAGRTRFSRIAALLSLGLYATYTAIWTVLATSGSVAFPSVADPVGLLAPLPIAVVLVLAIRGRVSPAEEAAVYLDIALIGAAIVAISLTVVGRVVYEVGGMAALLALAYPLEYLLVGAGGALTLLALRHPLAPRGAFALVMGAAVVGIAYLWWVVPASTSAAMSGEPSGHLFSVGILLMGYGACSWREAVSDAPASADLAAMLMRTFGPIAAAVTMGALLIGPGMGPLEPLLHATVAIAFSFVLIRQGILLLERSTMLDDVRLLEEDNRRLVAELRAELVERARVQDRLIENTRLAAVGELAAGVAHEVNNPLTGVLGYAELLLTDLPTDDPSRSDLETIRSQALRARAIIRSLDDFARPRDPERIAADLPALITRTVDLMRHPLGRSGVTITEAHGPLPPVEVEAQAIQQVVLNVLTNAMQAMPNGGTLRIESALRGGDAVVTIADDGVGMDEIAAGHAFVPFYSDRRESGAPGLGLSVALGLIESHDGSITLESAPGVGTTVVIRLPLRAATRPVDA